MGPRVTGAGVVQVANELIHFVDGRGWTPRPPRAAVYQMVSAQKMSGATYRIIRSAYWFLERGLCWDLDVTTIPYS